MNELVSVDTAAAVTGVSKRTLWRWLGSGSLQRQGMDERGRVMVAFSDIAPRLCVAFSAPSGWGAADELALLLEADRGDSEAQSDVALLCLQQGRADIAFYWFSLAAQQGHADAMHYLSELYQRGDGVEQCESTAMLWRAKAAGAGHAIARAQMAGVTSR